MRLGVVLVRAGGGKGWSHWGKERQHRAWSEASDLDGIDPSLVLDKLVIKSYNSNMMT